MLVIYETEDLDIWLQGATKQRKKIKQQKQNYFLDTFLVWENQNFKAVGDQLIVEWGGSSYFAWINGDQW